MQQIIGIDIGDVAVKKGTDYENDEGKYVVEFMDDFLSSIKTLSEAGHVLYFVSFCGYRRETQIRNFFKQIKEITCYIPEKKWIFVRDRKDKPLVCMKNKISIMIDDNVGICNDVLSRSPVTKHIILFSDRNSQNKKIIQINNWNHVVEYISKIQK